MIPQGSTWTRRADNSPPASRLRFFVVATSNKELIAFSDPSHKPDEDGETWRGFPGAFIKEFTPTT